MLLYNSSKTFTVSLEEIVILELKDRGVFGLIDVSRAKLIGMGERHINGTVQKSDHIADGLTVYYRSR